MARPERHVRESLNIVPTIERFVIEASQICRARDGEDLPPFQGTHTVRLRVAIVLAFERWQ